MSDLKQILQDGLKQIGAANSAQALDDVRVHFMGKKGLVTTQLKTVGTIGCRTT